MQLNDLPLFNLAGSKQIEAWYQKATARSCPRRIQYAYEYDKVLFPRRLIPYLNTEPLAEIDKNRSDYLVAQHLFTWLSFTVSLEVSVVNRVAMRLADGSSGLQLDTCSRQAAHQIYTDEGYHALFTMDVLHQLETAYKIPALPYDSSKVSRRLDAIATGRPDLTALIQILQVVIFETLVTSVLEEIPPDESIVSVVRDIVADHAEDERRHHAYFSKLFRKLWPSLDRQIQAVCAHRLPDLIYCSVLPDTDMAITAMRQCGIELRTAQDCIAEAYSESKTADYVKMAARKTIQLFRSCGVFEIPGVDESFAARGLS
jgi:hypothetical protein